MESGSYKKVLRNDWVEIPLSIVCRDIVGGGTPPTNIKEYWEGNIPWISSADIQGLKQIIPRKYITKEAIDNSATNLVPKKTIIVVTRVGLGKVAIAPFDLCFSQDNQGVMFQEGVVDDYYALYFLSVAVNEFKHNSRGTTINGVTKNQLKNLIFSLPPLPEQRAIVAKIEQLFSELDNGIASLKKAQEQLKVYRQAVLKWAFEGKLTEKWREENKDKLEIVEKLLKKIKEERRKCYEQELADYKAGKIKTTPKSPKELPPLTKKELAKLPKLPEWWCWVRLGELTLGVEYGTSAKSKENGKVPVLRMGNIQNFRFDWSDLVFTDNDEEISKYGLNKDDVLFNRTNSPELVGKTAIYKGERPAIFAGYLIRINQIPTIADGDFLNYFLNSFTAKNHGNSVKTDGVNQSNINGEKLINYPFPYTSIEEQKQIAQEIETRLSVADKLEETITDNLQKAEALRQSILKKAFEGKLLSARELEDIRKDPEWEPAEKLLERIKAEKQHLSKGRKP